MATKKTRRETGEITAKTAMHGDKLYQVRARAALPLLVRQAKAEQPIFYSDLALELDMPNPRNLNYVLGAIGNALIELGKEWNTKIPPIQCIVINKNTGIPGEGISWFVADTKAFKRSSKKRKKDIVQQMLTEVFQFGRWDDVLAKFNLSPAKNIAPEISTTRASSQRSRGGESKEHRQLKEFVANNPRVIGLPARAGTGQTEYELPSADVIDVLFVHGREWVGVEVKSRRSSVEDIVRGIYQCVKYYALVDAVQMVEQKRPHTRIILLLEERFPAELLGLKNTLGVEVVDGVSIS
jgi:hypothetical protein